MAQKIDPPSINSVLVVGGLIAGAYIVYKFSRVGASIGGALTDAQTAAINAFNAIKPTIAAPLTLSSYLPAVENRKANSFANMSDVLNTAPNPLYSDGAIYEQSRVDPMGNVIN